MFSSGFKSSYFYAVNTFCSLIIFLGSVLFDLLVHFHCFVMFTALPCISLYSVLLTFCHDVCVCVCMCVSVYMFVYVCAYKLFPDTCRLMGREG